MKIIDFHTHIFSENLQADRTPWLADPAFAELYSAPSSRIFRAHELIASMDRAAVDISVAMGFPWSDEKFISEQNNYLLEAAGASGGRIIAFASVPLNLNTDYRSLLSSLHKGGFAGIGETAFYKTGFGPEQEEILDRLLTGAEETGMPLCLHVNEPVGHSYSGKYTTPFHSLAALIERHPEAEIVLAHWGGGIIFYELMPEIKRAFRNVRYDTAASNFLYSPEIYRAAVIAAGAEKILFGSDNPLADPGRCIESFEGLLTAEERAAVLGGSAARLLIME